MKVKIFKRVYLCELHTVRYLDNNSTEKIMGAGGTEGCESGDCMKDSDFYYETLEYQGEKRKILQSN